ncbi:MAG: hypothetical protein M1838_005328 [Thelocarpon superellum]|nr:MAG: hypothetical protein M1838_005328 [Thelocarpon superellum]
MTSKLIPANPSAVSVIRKVTPNITTISAPFKRVGLFKIGGRGTIVRLSSGALAVFSPTALTPEVREVVTSLGNKVSYIAALDFEHHIFLGEWHKAFPEAKVIGPEGLPEKRTAQKNEAVPFAFVFTQENKAGLKIGEEFDSDFDYEYVGSHGNKEIVFNYKPDKTLIQADLLWNLPATEQYSRAGESATTGILSSIFSALLTTSGSAIWQKRFSWYAASGKDRPGFNASVQRIATWDFTKIIPCHGDVIEIDGNAVFKKVFAWHLEPTAAKQ